MKSIFLHSPLRSLKFFYCLQNISSVSHTSVVSEYDLQQLRDELSAAQRRADNAELMLLTTSDILRRCSGPPSQ
jgi:hypothetical protein